MAVWPRTPAVQQQSAAVLTSRADVWINRLKLFAGISQRHDTYLFTAPMPCLTCQVTRFPDQRYFADRRKRTAEQ